MSSDRRVSRRRKLLQPCASQELLGANMGPPRVVEAGGRQVAGCSAEPAAIQEIDGVLLNARRAEQDWRKSSFTFAVRVAVRASLRNPRTRQWRHGGRASEYCNARADVALHRGSGG